VAVQSEQYPADMTRRAPRKTESERQSRNRALMGHRYLPKYARPFPDDGIKLVEGLFISTLNVHEEAVRRMLLREGLITKIDIDADDLANNHARIDAAIMVLLARMISGNGLRPPSPAPVTIADETPCIDVHSAKPRRTARR
jgi:hypothetical protein